MFAGTSRQRRYITVHRIPLSKEKRKSLLAFHAITGSDTTSQFYGVARYRLGKSSKMHLTSWNTLEKKAKSVLTFLPKLKHFYANSTIREHKRWRSTKKEQQRFANPRKILMPYLRPRCTDSPHKAGKLSDYGME